ncbi:hypothetical protein QYF36_007613 [Acer negundo]|nr:hypothetical protein QYF36_007613 [Acer negundo]
MSFNYYPPCPQPEQVIVLAPHSDFGGITILLEVNDVQGLQIKKYGKWILGKSLPNAFIINIGDTLEILSNGTYRSIEHRATINSLKERLSVATFCSPKLDGDIGPAPSLVTLETPALLRRIGVVDYINSRTIFCINLMENHTFDKVVYSGVLNSFRRIVTNCGSQDVKTEQHASTKYHKHYTAAEHHSRQLAAEHTQPYASQQSAN